MSKILAIDINKTIRGSNLELNKNFLEKDVFKIIRSSETAGSYLCYRIVG